MTTPDAPEAVAVIGMAGRFPGAANIGEFWRNLRDGVESGVELDSDELVRLGADPEQVEGDDYVRRPLLLDGIAEFDAGFFGYSPTDAAILDPQQRIFLECAWRALEDAGCVPGRFDGSIGVYAGASMSGYLHANLLRGRTLDASPDSLRLLFGNDKDYLATRVSYQLDLDGPALSVQTACSTSLVAVHLAAQALLSYECDAALAGGVTVRVPHGIGYRYQEGSIFSPDGHCRPFDAAANGTTVGSGAGIVVLKRLSDAVADGDRIDAVLLGSAVNNDGARKVGYTAPGVDGQARAIAAALAVAGVSPDDIGAIEAHGTGTQLGDPIEVAALRKVFGDGAGRDAPVLLGSVKSNIGHLDSAAGIASFIKAVLQLRHGELVPSLNFTEPNPEIDFAASPFQVATATTGWKTNGVRRHIGVSSFGFGGTNAHAVLTEAPQVNPAGPSRPVHVLTMSARTKEGLDHQTDELAASLSDGMTGSLADVARTLATGRRAFRHRRIAVVPANTDPAAVADTLAGRDPDRVFGRRAASDVAVCWLFPGQGSQYPGMGAGLLADHPVYRDTVAECADLLRPHLDIGPLLAPDGDPDLLRQTRYTQPALFVVQVALARLLASWGLSPDVMLGHSIGELTAAHLAGVFDLPAALRLVTERGRLMQEQPTGAMLAVPLAEADVRATLPAELSLAAVNGPELCVVSGPDDAIERFRATLPVESTRLHTSHAFHSAMMRPAAAGLADVLSTMDLQVPGRPFVSNRTGAPITPEQATDPAYWAGQLLDPVRFGDGVAGLPDECVLLEVGPGHTLTSLARTCRRTVTATMLRAATEQGDDAVTVATGLGKLWLAGVDVDWAAVDGHAPRRRVALPGYAFQHRRYWVGGAPGTGPVEMPDVDVPDTNQDGSGTPVSGSGRAPRPELDTDYVSPETDLERRLAAIWADLLGVDPIGRHDPFLELGGHSLLAVKVVQRITAELGVTIPLRRLVKAGTVATLAALAVELGADETATPEDETAPAEELPGVLARPDEAYEPFPLTEMQQAQWIGRQGNFQLGNVAAHVYFEVDAPDVDLDRLQRAWNAVEARHDMLHAVITADGTQRVLPDVGPHPISVVDLRERSGSDVDTALTELRDRLSHEMRPTDVWPLFDVVAMRLPGDRVHIAVSFDLLIADIGSIRVVLRDWGRAYADEELPPLGVSYRDYVLAAERVRDTAPYARSLEYWRARVTELPPPPRLPQAVNPSEIRQPRFAARGRLLPLDVWERLTERGARHGLTPSAILLAAYGSVLGTWCREGRFTINTTVVNRLPLHPDVDDLVGEFASFDLLPLDLTHGTFAEIGTAVQEQSWEDLEYRHVNGVDVLRELARVRGGTAGGVMPVVFTSTLVQQTEGVGESMLGWLGEIVHESAQTPQVWLDGAVIRAANGIYLSWIGIDELFPADLLGTMLDEYESLLTELADSDEQWTRPPRSAMPAAQRELVARVNDTTGVVPDGLLHENLLRRAEQRPDAPAVLAPDRDLTFGELVGHAGALATRLRSLGAGPGQLVAVSLPKSAEQVVAALAVMIVGAAYLPVDPDLPAARQDRLLELGRCRFAVGAADREWPAGIQGLAVDWTTEQNLPPQPARQDDLAYVIFTSGSTGEPKGVAVSHRAALNTCVDICERFGVGPDDRVLGLSSLSFDLSVWDVFGVLGAGGALVLPEPAARRDPARWLELVRERHVTVWNSVPALAQMFVDHVSDAGPLRLMMLSGDWIPVRLPERVWSVAPDCQVVSLGGATEAAIWSIYHEVREVDPSWESIPYGRPLRNQRWHVLNDRWQECPVHATGELFIAGVGLADGYFGDPERTAASFVTHPVTGERLYRTGDLGRRRPDGSIEFLGREDFQVKVGGYRIELGEIENALADHDAVRDAVVAALGDRHHRRLVGYVIPSREVDDLETVLDAHLRTRLPAYMVPTAVLTVDSFPLTGNGKVDRAALPDPTASLPEPDGPADADPTIPTELTERIAAIVAEVVGVADVDPRQGYLATGGDSIGAVRIVSRANAEGIDLTLQDLFEQPTIGHAAQAVHTRGGTATTTGRTLPLNSGQRARLDAAPRWRSLAVAPSVDEATATTVTTSLLAAFPALRLRLTESRDAQYVEAMPETPGYVPMVDLTALPAARRTAAYEAMLAEIADELDPVAGPSARTALFALDTDDHRLVWLAHPFVLDEPSWDVLCAATENALSGTTIPPVGAFPDWLATLAADEPRDEPTTPAPPAGPEFEPPADDTTSRAALSETETDELARAVADTYRMTLDEVAFAAVLATVDGSGWARCGIERDARSRVDGLPATHAVGPFTSYGVTTATVGGRSPDRLLADAKEAARAAGPAAQPPTVLLGWPSASARAPITVTAGVVDGRLAIEWTGHGDAERMAAVLRELAEHCRSTGAGAVSASDFPMAGLDGDELAAVLDGLRS